MSERAWSLKLDAETPPTRYCGTLASNVAHRTDASNKMGNGRTNTLQLEKDALVDVSARDLRRDIAFLEFAVCRMAYMVFERGGCNPLDPAFNRFMMFLFEILPDSRVVEERLANSETTYCF